MKDRNQNKKNKWLARLAMGVAGLFFIAGVLVVASLVPDQLRPVSLPEVEALANLSDAGSNAPKETDNSTSSIARMGAADLARSNAAISTASAERTFVTMPDERNLKQMLEFGWPVDTRLLWVLPHLDTTQSLRLAESLHPIQDVNKLSENDRIFGRTYNPSTDEYVLGELDLLRNLDRMNFQQARTNQQVLDMKIFPILGRQGVSSAAIDADRLGRLSRLNRVARVIVAIHYEQWKEAGAACKKLQFQRWNETGNPWWDVEVYCWRKAGLVGRYNLAQRSLVLPDRPWNLAREFWSEKWGLKTKEKFVRIEDNKTSGK